MERVRVAITVADVLKIPPFRGSTVLVGHSGLQRTVSAVSVIDSPDGVHWVWGGELLITSGFWFKDDPAVQRSVLQDLISHGAAALGLKLGRYISELPRAMVELAAAHEFPILGLPFGPAWTDFILPVTRLILSRKGAGAAPSVAVEPFLPLQEAAAAFQVLVLDLREEPGAAPIRPELRERLHRLVIERCTVRRPVPLIRVDQEGRVAVLVPAGAAVQALAEELSAAARAQDLRVQVGIGRVHPGVSVVASYAEAVQALTLCKRLYPGRNSLEYAKLGIYRLVTEGSPQPDLLASFVQDVLGTLTADERGERLNLVETLRTYVETRGQIRQTARQLYVHPNTVRYRLEHIRKLTGLNPGVADEFLQLHLALKVMHLLPGWAGPAPVYGGRQAGPRPASG